jgi:hypothetical protein
MLGRSTIDSQKLLVLITEVTLQVSHLLARNTILLGHTAGLLGKGLDLLGITTKMTPTPYNDAVTPTFYKNKNFVQIGVHIKMHITL